jgi:hypothetical protein
MTDDLNKNHPFFSIAIPAYGYNGRGSSYLQHNLLILEKQNFKDFEVVISDHSTDNTIKNIYDSWKDKLNIKYIPNNKGRGYISPNLNVSMQNCIGKWIKILFQDDFLYDENSLKKTNEYLFNNKNTKWLATEFYHSNDGINLYRHYIPKWVDDIWTGNNTMGCPSSITIKNENLLLFEESIEWLMDVEYYKRMFDKFGPPNIMNEITVVNRTNQNDRDSHSFTQEHMNLELEFVNKRFNK